MFLNIINKKIFINKKSSSFLVLFNEYSDFSYFYRKN